MRSFRLLIAILSLLALHAPASASPPAAGPGVAEAKPTVEIRVDPRIELLAAVQFLSDYDWSGLITRHDFPYKEQLAAHFEPYREHPVVGMFSRISREGFAFDAPVSAVLHLTDPPELAPISPFDETLCRRAGSAEQLNRFVQALRDFCKDSAFLDFFEAQQPFYETVAKASAPNLEGVDVGVLEDYYGVKQHSYAIITAPLFHSGGFGPRVKRADGTFDVYSVIGPRGVADDLPYFGTPESFRHLVWHEFSHSFVNPVVDRHGEEVEKYAALMSPIRSAMSRQAYPDWRTCVYEHCVRAVTCRLAAREIDDEAFQETLNYERGRSFIYVEALCERLEEYEQHRDRYPTFDSFFPELIASLDKPLEDLPGVVAATPKVLRTVPETGARNVDPTITELLVEFDCDMGPGGYSWVQRSDETYPETTGKAFWRSPRICVLPVKLLPDHEYWIGLNAGGFQGFFSAEGGAAEEHILEFKTAASADAAKEAAIPPRVIRTIPQTGAANVHPNLTELRVEFDQDMIADNYSFVQRDANTFPEVTGSPYWETPRICILPVMLKPSRTYWLGLNTGQFKSFMSEAGTVAEAHVLEFTTSD